MTVADDLRAAPVEFILNRGVTFALFPVKCWDGKWAWLRIVGWADVQRGFFYSPKAVTRVYSITRTAP